MTDDFLRQSQIVTTFGPGSMVDLPDRAVLIEGLQSWRWDGRTDDLQEPRLAAKIRHALTLEEVRLVMPPAFDERPGVTRGQSTTPWGLRLAGSANAGEGGPGWAPTPTKSATILTGCSCEAPATPTSLSITG